MALTPSNSHYSLSEAVGSEQWWTPWILATTKFQIRDTIIIYDTKTTDTNSAHAIPIGPFCIQTEDEVTEFNEPYRLFAVSNIA